MDELPSFEKEALSTLDDLSESSAGRTAVRNASDRTPACENDLDEDFDLLFNLDAEMGLPTAKKGANENDPDRGVEWTPLCAPNPSAVEPRSPSLRHSGALTDMSISTPA